MRSAAWYEAVRLATLCRLYQRRRDTAQSILKLALSMHCVSSVTCCEMSICIAAWGRVMGVIPALSYLNVRGMLKY